MFSSKTKFFRLPQSSCETFFLLLYLKAKCRIQKTKTNKKTQGQCRKALEFWETFHKVT